ncbi:glycosyltransferase family 4 protein [Verrucomicrobiota bacterium]
MKIGISAQLLNDKPSGVEQYIYNLIIHLLENDRQNTYYIYCYDTHLSRRFSKYKNAVTRRIRLPQARIFRVIHEQLILPSLLKKDRIDVYHSPAYIVPFFLPDIRTVVTIPDIFAITRPQFCKPHNRLYFGIMLPRSIKQANKLITLSNVVKRDIIDTFRVNPEDICVNYPGVSPQRGISPDIQSNYILYVGNFDPKKDISLLMRAFELLKKNTGVQHKLVLAGEKSWGFRKIYPLAQRSEFLIDLHAFAGMVGV